ncbi:MAG: ribonuclease P protein component [Cyanobacteria bacterium RI_101]|nr:ribonuclease P protein component [Cyanobacteria bacterium RI_101]
MGLPAPLRLKRRQDFQRVYQQGKRYRGACLLLRVLKEPGLAQSRFGISVSRKVSKRAVDRNRLKRRARGVILRLLPRLGGGFQVIIVVLPQAALYNSEHFLRELEQLFTQAGIIPYGH